MAWRASFPRTPAHPLTPEKCKCQRGHGVTPLRCTPLQYKQTSTHRPRADSPRVGNRPPPRGTPHRINHQVETSIRKRNRKAMASERRAADLPQFDVHLSGRDPGRLGVTGLGGENDRLHSVVSMLQNAAVPH